MVVVVVVGHHRRKQKKRWLCRTGDAFDVGEERRRVGAEFCLNAIVLTATSTRPTAIWGRTMNNDDFTKNDDEENEMTVVNYFVAVNLIAVANVQRHLRIAIEFVHKNWKHPQTQSGNTCRGDAPIRRFALRAHALALFTQTQSRSKIQQYYFVGNSLHFRLLRNVRF